MIEYLKRRLSARENHLHPPGEHRDTAASFALDNADFETHSAFLSERGLILIACAVFCALVWSAVLLWIFG